MVEVCGVRPFHPLASASSKESLKRKNSSSVALQTRSAALGRPLQLPSQDLPGRHLDRDPVLVGQVADDEGGAGSHGIRRAVA